ncbi:putative ethanolamine kinase [Clavispora lusitaniae]|uniref:ethanolamine kinase n=1 Tax=Clavispora lusitaniae TaxID=36911 RepID=A0AA91Q136_CLALS|nr:putative ethanolamine kinase [Clavispora lusitaniae]
MSSPVYCILSGGAVHCIPVTVFTPSSSVPPPEKLARKPEISTHQDTLAVPKASCPTAGSFKNKSLLYTLNNPSLSDLESDTTQLANTAEEDNEEAAKTNEEAAKNEEALPPAASNGSVSPKTPSRLAVLRSSQDDSDNEAEIVSRMNIDLASEVSIESVLNEYSTHAVYMPEYFVDLETNLTSDYTQIKQLLTKIFPDWKADVAIKQLTGGITNMLLSCTHGEETLLMRVYGKGTNLIIDRHREFVSHLVLNSLKLAPPIHARFSNGLIYGFFPGRSLDPKELSHPGLFPLIAQQLGNVHNSVNCEYIEDGVEKLRKYTANLKKQSQPKPSQKSSKRDKKVKRTINSVWDLLEDWIQIVPENEALVNVFKANLPSEDVSLENIRHVILEELKWLKSTLLRASKSPVVVSHCDLLSGNIIIPETSEFQEYLAKDHSTLHLPSLEDNPLKFIDYEYMLPAPRAFDIANHFAEWQGFDCDRSAIPEPSASNPVMINWCKSYLNNIDASSEETGALIDEIACYYGMPGFYWGIWAMIQSELSTIDFNYAEYSELRLEEYWQWKRNFTRAK